jgi:hypothetical protein
MDITVPFITGQLKEKNKQELLKKLNQFNADEVFLAWCDIDYSNEQLKESVIGLKAEADFLTKNGYKVAIWIPTLSRYSNNRNHQAKVHMDGTKSPTACPLCENFISDFCSTIKGLAQAGFKKIVLDDDFRMQLAYYKTSCFCDAHLKFYSEYLGKNVTKEEMYENLYQTNEPNEYRKAWMAGCQAGLEKLAKAIRLTADEIDENIEIMICAGPAHFGADGTSVYKLADILRGKNQKREFRLIGAPYWHAHGYVTNPIEAYEFARQQAYDAKKKGYYTVGEGDPHHRPRFVTSASELEFFHTIMLADGNCDRLMKYGLDYYSTFDYENGYADFSELNKPIYAEIENVFNNKVCTGFNVVEPFNTIEKAKILPDKPDIFKLTSGTRKFMVDLSLPTCSEPGGVNVIFGEHANNVDFSILKNGNIIDMPSALYLNEQGIDVGFSSVDKITTPTGWFNEYYLEQNDVVRVYDSLSEHCNFTLKDTAKVLSVFKINNTDVIGSYIYENKDGQKFLVLNFNVEKQMNSNGLVRSYYRQAQVVGLYEWLNGKKLDAISLKNPYLYILTKKKENSLAIGLWNNFADAILKPVVDLGESYKKARFVNCKGQLIGNKVILDNPLGAYAFCFIELEK